MPTFTCLAIDDPQQLRFGTAPTPLTTRRGLVLGGGTVYPELNFTLPAMLVTQDTMSEVRRQYSQMITASLQRAVALEVPGVVIEFETLPPMTQNPAWAVELTEILADALEDAWVRYQLKSVLRVTPNDTREFDRPPILRQGENLAQMLETFEGCAKVGAELLSIESVGGKEVHDEALQMGDLAGVIFSLCILGERDMRFLWSELDKIAKATGTVCAGDTACGFGNTAMVLAEQQMIPRVFAAVVRAISAVRSLVAYECGAVGPGKDCGYENPILKAITGYPMAMEGKTAACAHFSPLGNIAAATCDTWSNESVQNVQLLAGMAPACYMEQLTYDCRLMNAAISIGPDAAAMLQRCLVQSDAALDPQAFILTPPNVIELAREIVAHQDAYQAGVAVARKAIDLLEQGLSAGHVQIHKREQPWLAMMRNTLDDQPDDIDNFISQQAPLIDANKCRLAEYDLAGA